MNVPDFIKGKSVLMVDDDPDFVFQQRTQLEAAGLKVRAVGSKSEAEAEFARELPQLVLLDLMLEDLDAGFTLCYHFKKKAPQVPIIMISNVAGDTGMEFDVTTPEERSWVKADVMLQKPVRFEELLREMARLLE